MNEINWPEGFVPGFTDNFVSNEMIISGLNVKDIWPLLSQPFLWPKIVLIFAFTITKSQNWKMGCVSISKPLVFLLKLRLWSLSHRWKANLLVWPGTDGPVKKILLNVSMYIMHGYWRIFPVTGYIS